MLDIAFIQDGCCPRDVAMHTLHEFLHVKLQSFAFLNGFIEHDGVGNFVHLSLRSSVIRQEVHNLVSSISLANLVGQHHTPLHQHLHILVSGTWPNLASLDLSGLNMTTPGSFGSQSCMAQLCNGDWPVLTVLNLSHTRLDRAAVTRLTEVRLPKLETLDVSWNWLDDDAAVQLQQAQWPGLQFLSLRFNLLRVPAVAALTSSWPMLKSLNLRSNFIDSNATAQLAQGQWPLLEHLDLRTNRGTDVWKLREGLWPQLRTVSLDLESLGSDGASWLLAKWPGLKIETGRSVDDMRHS